jgi:hypothetical protein
MLLYYIKQSYVHFQIWKCTGNYGNYETVCYTYYKKKREI